MRTVMSSFLFALAAITALAQPTENHGLRVTPAPPDLRIDGDAADWDLTQTLFVCGDVTRHAETYAVRIGAAYDAQHLYLLAHWYDRTPMNNPGQVSADFGWLGDCLQLRLRTDRVTHVTAWRGVAGGDVVDLTYDRDFKGGNIKNAKSAGVQQAFGALAEGSGYVQELAFPWALITADKQPLRTGDVLGIGVEANFTLANGNRLTVKGNFAPDIEPDRIFTYTKPQVWGPATLLPEAPTEPQSVRLTDGRIFPTRMEERGPVIDWTGLAVADSAKPEGVKTLTFDVPANGYLSTIIKNADGRVVRHLLNSQPSTTGAQTVGWDGLSTPASTRRAHRSPSVTTPFTRCGIPSTTFVFVAGRGPPHRSPGRTVPPPTGAATMARPPPWPLANTASFLAGSSPNPAGPWSRPTSTARSSGARNSAG